MPDTPHLEAGKHFAADLRRIREARGLSVNDLQEETKIPLRLIGAFEQTALFGHPMFNRVYLRSLVRTYAGFVGVTPAAALEALDRALEGRYEGELARVYLGESAGLPEAAEKVADPAEAEPAPVVNNEEGSLPEDGDAGAASGEDAAAGTEQLSPEVSHRAARVRQPARLDGARSPLAWVATAAAIVALAALAFLFLRSPGQDEPGPGGGPAADTGWASAGRTSSRPPASGVRLGEVMYFTVVAREDKVDPIRITRDSDLRRPYWIELGEATVFPVEERIIFEGELDNIQLLIEGYAYPTDRRDERGRVVIDRPTAQAFLDTVQARQVRLATSPDTNRIPVL